MSKRKALVAIVIVVIVLAAAVALAPSAARAQGLVEYGLCLVAAQDTGVLDPANPDDAESIAGLEEILGIAWQPNYGAIGTCLPKFHRTTHEFTKIQLCFSAYADVDGSGFLSPFDTEEARVCETLKF